MDPTARAVVCVCLCLFVVQVRGSHIPQRMNRTIQNLLQHYKIPVRERFNGKPVFSKDPLSGKMEAKKLFMGGILGTYEELISQMLKQLPIPSPQTTASPQSTALGATLRKDSASNAGSHHSVRKELIYIQTMVHNLKNHYQEQERLLTGLQSLQKIKTDNFVVQSKALGELPWLYEEASSLVDNNKAQRRRRRRRQTQKAKKRAKDGKQ